MPEKTKKSTVHIRLKKYGFDIFKGDQFENNYTEMHLINLHEGTHEYTT